MVQQMETVHVQHTKRNHAAGKVEGKNEEVKSTKTVADAIGQGTMLHAEQSGWSQETHRSTKER